MEQIVAGPVGFDSMDWKDRLEERILACCDGRWRPSFPPEMMTIEKIRENMFPFIGLMS